MRYHFQPLPARSPAFAISVTRPDGTQADVGTIRYFYIRHLERSGWEATGPDGHLGVHEHRWQAAWALTWNRVGYPFPVAASHERDVVEA